MSTELWLDEDFDALWRGRDPFAAAAALDGEVFRALEQRQTLAFEVAGKRYFIKRHRGARWREIFKNLLTLRLPVVSARNEFIALRSLQKLGIGVPRVAAYGRRGLLPATLESFLVTHDVGPHENLEDHCRDWAHEPPPFAQRRALLLQVAELSRRMHGAGICHRDFYLCHLLRPRDSAELWLIDLHRALVKKRLRRRWIVKDLAGLYFSAMDAGLSRTDLLRFMRAYSAQPLRRVLAAEGGFWNDVKKRALAMYRRDRQRSGG